MACLVASIALAMSPLPVSTEEAVGEAGKAASGSDVNAAAFGSGGEHALHRSADATGATPDASANVSESERKGSLPDPIERYDVEEHLGFTVRINRDLTEQRPEVRERVMRQLAADLDVIANRVPAPAVALLRDEVEIWVELQGRDTSGRSPRLRGMCCHWSADWLAANGVLVEKTGSVEILNPDDYLNWIDQPFMVLHELAHAYHWRLAHFDDEIEAAWQSAKDAGLYDEVHRNSVPYDRRVPAYAMTNSREYFAELTEAYFGLNDFFPYSRRQLEQHDPNGAALIARIWSLGETELEAVCSDR